MYSYIFQWCKYLNFVQYFFIQFWMILCEFILLLVLTRDLWYLIKLPNSIYIECQKHSPCSFGFIVIFMKKTIKFYNNYSLIKLKKKKFCTHSATLTQDSGIYCLLRRPGACKVTFLHWKLQFSLVCSCLSERIMFIKFRPFASKTFI